jgi:hypothetical protein
MPRYEKAPAEVRQIVERMMDRYHPQLRDAKLTITCLMAFPTLDKNGDSTGPALKVHGYAAQAVVKIIGLKERTDGRDDAEICIDGDNWPTLSDAQKDALLDHELEHLELKTDKDGFVVRDDLDRPKLKMRKHDHEHGWFDSIVRRHGRNAPEFIQFEEFQTTKYKQNWLPYLDDPDQTRVEADPVKELPKGEGQEPLATEVTGEFKKMGILAGSESKSKRKRAFAGRPSRSHRKAASRR